MQLYSSQFVMQSIIFWDNLCNLFDSFQHHLWVTSVILPLKHRLTGRAEQDGHTELPLIGFESIHYGLQVVRRQRLHLIKNQHAIAKVMQFAAMRWLVGIHRLKQLYVGRHHNGIVPVLGSKPHLKGKLVCFILVVSQFFERHIVMVFQHILRPKDFAKGLGSLHNDAGIRNGNDYTFLAMFQGMAHSPYQ